MSKAGESILRGAREALDYAQGEREGFAAHVPEEIDVKAIRQRTGLSQPGSPPSSDSPSMRCATGNRGGGSLTWPRARSSWSSKKNPKPFGGR